MFYCSTLSHLLARFQLHRLADRFYTDIVRALVRTFIARGASALGAFALVVILGRLYGARGVGVYALSVSLVIGAGVLGRWGMNNALVRFVGRDLSSAKAWPLLMYACRKATIISLIAVALVFILHAELSIVFHSPAFDEVVWGMGAAIPAYVLAYVLSGFLAAVHKPATACLLQNGAISFATAIIIVCVHATLPTLGLVVLGWAYAVAAWAAFIWGGATTWSWMRAHSTLTGRLDQADITDFRRSSSAFLATDVAGFLMGVVGVWVAGSVLLISDVGLYKAALQFANVIAMVLVVINLIFPTRFAHLYNTGDLAGLGRLARRGASAGLFLALIPILLCVFMPELVLRAVGPDFMGAALPLQILAIGQLFNVGCGPVGHVLNMSGFERVCRNIVWVANVIGLIVLIIGTVELGIIGTALGVAFAQILRKSSGVYYCWRILGIWVLPVPNVLKLIGINGGCCARTVRLS